MFRHTHIDGSCAGLMSTVVWLSQINRQEQSDGIEWRLYFNALMKMFEIMCEHSKYKLFNCTIRIRILDQSHIQRINASPVTHYDTFYKSPKLEIDPPYPYSCNGSLVPWFKLMGQLRASTEGLENSWRVQWKHHILTKFR